MKMRIILMAVSLAAVIYVQLFVDFKKLITQQEKAQYDTTQTSTQ